MSNQGVRLNLLIPPPVRERLEALMSTMGLRTMTDVVIHSLRLADMCTKAEQEGATIIAQYPDGRQVPLPRSAA